MTTFLKKHGKLLSKDGKLLASSTPLGVDYKIITDIYGIPLVDSDGKNIVANPVYYIFPVTGRTSGTPTNGTMTFSATEDLTVTGTDDVVIESVTRAADSTFRSHTVVISCPNNGSGKVIITGKSKVVSLGDHGGSNDPTSYFYIGTDETSPILTWNLDDVPNSIQKIRQPVSYISILPTTGVNKMPDTLIYLWLAGTTNIIYSNTGAFPPNLRTLYLSGANINWVGTIIGNTTTPPNMTRFTLFNYRNPSDNMTYTELLQLLDGLINRVGTLPATVTIREQIPANVTAIAAATPDVAGTDEEQCKYYINLIKSTKGVTTFTLNTTNI